jgi:hypothetical protein
MNPIRLLVLHNDGSVSATGANLCNDMNGGPYKRLTKRPNEYAGLRGEMRLADAARSLVFNLRAAADA